MIVVDVGCHPQGAEESVHNLCRRFQPSILFGFDPYPALEEGVEWVGSTLVVRRRLAAWINLGMVPFKVDGIASRVTNDEGDSHVRCFDLSEFLMTLPTPIILKLDAEGSEFPILHHLAARGGDERLDLVLVEWHEGVDPGGDYFGGTWSEIGRPELKCPVEFWQ